MMKAGVKSLIIFMAGFGASGGLTGALTYYFTKKKFMKISDERVKSLEEYIEELQMEKLARDLGYGSVVSEEGETDGKEAGSSEGEENYIPKEDMNFNPNRERPLSNIKAQNDEAYIREVLKKLTDLGAKSAALTGISFKDDEIGVYYYDGGVFEWMYCEFGAWLECVELCEYAV